MHLLLTNTQKESHRNPDFQLPRRRALQNFGPGFLPRHLWYGEWLRPMPGGCLKGRPHILEKKPKVDFVFVSSNFGDARFEFGRVFEMRQLHVLGCARTQVDVWDELLGHPKLLELRFGRDWVDDSGGCLECHERCGYR